jgi:hypothetical protein
MTVAQELSDVSAQRPHRMRSTRHFANIHDEGSVAREHMAITCKAILNLDPIFASLARRRLQKLLRGDQIGRAETLGEAVVDRLEACGGCGGSALLAEQPG